MGLNVFVLAPMPTWYAYHTIDHWYSPVHGVQDVLWCTLLSFLFLDAWFYGTHRLLHTPRMYRAIHCVHHQWYKPTSMAAFYAHPAEFMVGNLCGVIVGPLIASLVYKPCINGTLFVVWVLCCFTGTMFAHSGSPALGASAHDRHHSL